MLVLLPGDPKGARCSHFLVRICPTISGFCQLTGISARGPQGRSDTALRPGSFNFVSGHLDYFGKEDHEPIASCVPPLVPSRFSSVVLPIFGSTTDKFRKLYPLRLVSQHQSSSKWLAPCCAPRSLLSGARTYRTNEYNRGEKQGFV